MDWIRLLWAAMLLSGSGVISLALSLDSNAKRIALIAGIVLETVFGALVFIAHRKVVALIARLEAMP